MLPHEVNYAEGYTMFLRPVTFGSPARYPCAETISCVKDQTSSTKRVCLEPGDDEDEEVEEDEEEMHDIKEGRRL